MGDEPRSVLQAGHVLPVCVSARSSHGAMGSECDFIQLSSVDGKYDLPDRETMMLTSIEWRTALRRKRKGIKAVP